MILRMMDCRYIKTINKCKEWITNELHVTYLILCSNATASLTEHYVGLMARLVGISIVDYIHATIAF
jgi:hypothetical protein